MNLRELIASDVEDVFLNTDDFAEACVYHRRSGTLLDVTLLWDRRSDRRRSDAQDDDEYDAITDVAIGSAAQLVVDEKQFTPEPGDEIERTDPNGEPKRYLVFPTIGQHAWRYSDPTRTMLRIFTVSRDDVEHVFYDPPIGEAFMWDAVVGAVRGDMVNEPNGDMVKVMRETVYGPTQQLIDNGVTELQHTAKLGTARYADWMIDITQSTWGPGRVKLELVRRPIARHVQMEHNAAV